MSAKFNLDDKGWLFSITPDQRVLDNMEEALVVTTFDAQTEQDVVSIEKTMKQTSFLKRVCLYKILTFPFEYLLMVLFFKKEHKSNKKLITRLYWKFLRNKISMTDFKKELSGYSKEGKII